MLTTIGLFILGLAPLVFFHELGHFLVAKWAGIRVEQFSLGFGPKLLAFRKGETEYKISLLPLGGYVKMSGEEPEDEKIIPVDDPRSFASQALYKRVMVVLAGPVMNLLLALVFMPLVFMVGHQEPSFLHQESIVIGVKKDSPAEKNGIQIGDKIVEIEGHAVKQWREVLQSVMMSPNQNIEFKISRNNEIKNFKIKLDSDADGKIGVLGVEPPYFIGNDPVIAEISPDSPAQTAGLEAKDKIISIDGKEISTWDEMSEKVSHSEGKNLQLQILRKGEKKNISITPRYDQAYKKWVLGVSKFIPEGSLITVQYSFSESLLKGVDEYKKLVGLTFKVLKKLFSFELSYKALGGPIQIAQETRKAASTGFGGFVYFISFLSIQLGVMNLLPIPVLDGGHLFFMLFEVARGKPLTARTRMIAMQVGMALLFSVMILVTFNDVSNSKVVPKLINYITGKF